MSARTCRPFQKAPTGETGHVPVSTVKRYSVANWQDAYETNETRKLVKLRWVPVPNRHDGLGFRRVAACADRCEIFSAWVLILEVASRMRTRGVLANEAGPLGPEDLALMTAFPAAIFERALTFLSNPKIGWIIVEDIDGGAACSSKESEPQDNLPGAPEIPRLPPDHLPEVPPEGRKEWNGSEGNEPKPSPGGVPDKPAPTSSRVKKKAEPIPDPPQQDEIVAFVRDELGLPAADGEFLFLHWQENGFTRDGKPIRDWRLTARKWKAGGFLPSQKHVARNGNSAAGYVPRPKAPSCI